MLSANTLVLSASALANLSRPCTSEAGKAWDRQNDPIWATSATMQAYAHCFSARMKLQSPACAPAYILPSAMEGKPYLRWLPSQSTGYDLLHIGLHCHPADGSVCRTCDSSAVPAFPWVPKLWACRWAVARGDLTLLVQLRGGSKDSFWASCLSCNGNGVSNCDARLHQLDDPPDYDPDLLDTKPVPVRKSNRQIRSAMIDEVGSADETQLSIGEVDEAGADRSQSTIYGRKYFPARPQIVHVMGQMSQKIDPPRKRIARPRASGSSHELRRPRQYSPDASDDHASSTNAVSGVLDRRHGLRKRHRSNASAADSSPDDRPRRQVTGKSARSHLAAVVGSLPEEEDVKLPVEGFDDIAIPPNMVESAVAKLDDIQTTLRQLHTASQMKDLRIHQLQQALLASGHRPDLAISQEYDFGLPARPIERLSGDDEVAWRALDAARRA